MSTMYIFSDAPCTLCQYVLANKDLQNAMVMLALKRRLGELKCECSAKRVTKYWFIGYFKGKYRTQNIIETIFFRMAIIDENVPKEAFNVVIRTSANKRYGIF